MNDGTISKQEPDGEEIVASMKRAVVADSKVEWTETCFCTPPLNHERTTIYDQFFENMRIKPLESAVNLRGERFWDQLRTASRLNPASEAETVITSQIKYVPLRIL